MRDISLVHKHDKTSAFHQWHRHGFLLDSYEVSKRTCLLLVGQTVHVG